MHQQHLVKFISYFDVKLLKGQRFPGVIEYNYTMKMQ